MTEAWHLDVKRFFSFGWLQDVDYFSSLVVLTPERMHEGTWKNPSCFFFLRYPCFC